MTTYWLALYWVKRCLNAADSEQLYVPYKYLLLVFVGDIHSKQLSATDTANRLFQDAK